MRQRGVVDRRRKRYVNEGQMKRIQTYVLNCTVKPRYSGEKAYATPPATAKKAPHCHTRSAVVEGERVGRKRP
jgi:hypothetical protein